MSKHQGACKPFLQVAKIFGPSSFSLSALHMIFYLEEGEKIGASSGHTSIPAAG